MYVCGSLYRCVCVCVFIANVMNKSEKKTAQKGQIATNIILVYH